MIDLQTACQSTFPLLFRHKICIQLYITVLCLGYTVLSIFRYLPTIRIIILFHFWLCFFLWLIDAQQISLEDSMHWKACTKKNIFSIICILYYVVFPFAQTKRKLCPPVFFLIQSRKFNFSLEYSTKHNFLTIAVWQTVFQICISTRLNIANFLGKLWKHHKICWLLTEISLIRCC